MSTGMMGTMLASVVKKASFVGSIMLGAMMLVTVADVLGRKFAGHPVRGAYEICEFLLVFVVFLNMAGCEIKDGNVKIDTIVVKLRKRTQGVINTISYVFFLLTCCLMAWTLFLYAAQEVGGKLTSVLQIPVFPFIFVAGLGSLLLTFVVLVRTWTFLTGVWRK
jgi:TRAP-type transport system small permease protein